MAQDEPLVESVVTRGAIEHHEIPVGKRAVSGALFLTASTYAGILLGIVARKILSIILTPEEFGQIATALSFVDLIFAFGAFSFSSAIINARDNLLERPLAHLRENIYILTAGVGVFATIVSIIAAWLFPPELAPQLFVALVGIYAVQRCVTSFDTFFSQILERELDYKRISIISFIVNVLLHVASVGLALAGFTSYSIPVATLLSSFISLYLHRAYLRKRQGPVVDSKPWQLYDKATMKWLWAFGGAVMLNRLFESWLYRIDNLIVFKLMNYAALGFYSQAFMIAQMASTALAPIVARVSIATYAEVQHDRRRLEEAFAVTNFFLVRILVPAALFFLVCAPDLVRLFLSTNWYRSAEPLAAMAGFVLFSPLFENGKMLLGARLKLKEISFVRIAQLLSLIGMLLLFGSEGLWAIGLAVSIVTLMGYGLLLMYVGREVGLRTNEVFVYPLAMAMLLVIPLLFADRALAATLTPGENIETAIARIAMYVVALPLVTLGLEWLVARERLKRYIAAVRSRM
ncbi:MAG TPA: oligosaccharide flippase family protein [Candidatus Kapabacteria bacterium]|nr:oligosaccharide flippase family protein [Candidatus Kapabacteria bacterium]